MFDLIAIGNISIDLFYQGESLTVDDKRFQLAIGGKYFTDAFFEGVGGGGANVTIGTRKLGMNSTVLGKIGTGDFGRLILSKLRMIGVDTSLIQKADNYLNISSILVDEKGGQTVINYNSPDQCIMANNQDLEKLLQAKIVYLGNLPNVLWEEKTKIINFLSDHKVLAVTNIGVKDCRRPTEELESFLNKTNVLIVNAHEFSDIAKKKYEEIDFHKNIIEFTPFLNGKTVIVTDGEHGSYGYSQNQNYFQGAVKIDKVVQSAGCGDAYTSGFIAEYSKSKDIVSSMQKGAEYAAHILSQLGAN